MKRIGFVTTVGAPWGGCEELWTRAAAKLAQQGFSIAAHVRAWPEKVPQLEKLEREGCQVRHAHIPGRVGRWLGRSWVKWLDQVQPEFVVISQALHIDGVEWMQACQHRRIPYALIVQCAGESWWPADDEIQKLAEGYEKAEACFFVSEGNLDLVRRQLATPIEHASIIRNPFNVAYQAAPEWPAVDEVYRLACVARLEPKAKGQDILFQVLAQEKWRHRKLEVSLFGSGPNRVGLMKLREMYQLSNIFFRGFTEDIEQVWRDHHALVLPSRYEGLPLALVEAMLCGRPCIVTDVAGNAELVEDNVSGFVAAAPSVRALDQALERAWERRSGWKSMGQIACQQIRRAIPRDPTETFVSRLMSLSSMRRTCGSMDLTELEPVTELR